MKRQEFVVGLGGVEALFIEDLLHLLTAGFGTERTKTMSVVRSAMV
jgi:hypothetical protein